MVALDISPGTSRAHGRDEGLADAQLFSQLSSRTRAFTDHPGEIWGELGVAAPPDVFELRNRFEVIRVDAELDFAKVVELKPIRNRASLGFVNQSMGGAVAAMDEDTSVAITAVSPNMAWRPVPHVSHFVLSKAIVAAKCAADVLRRVLGGLTTSAFAKGDLLHLEQILNAPSVRRGHSLSLEEES